MKRKLTTIFCADGVQFSALMEKDEAGTLKRLNRYRAIMAELFARHDGRQVNTWGDMVIAEFPSVVEAVRCAVEVQDAVSSENRDLLPEKQMRFRIGVNLGDVMMDGDDLYGDGVNVAARLQSLAEPGGVMVSGTVHALTHKLLAIGFDYAGEQKVKSIDEPIESYRIRQPGENRPAEPSAEPPAERPADRAPEQAPDQSPDQAPDQTPDAPGFSLTPTARRADGALAWIMDQPMRVQRAAGMIGFFAALNILFTGIATPWFIFPSAPFAIYIWRHYARQKRG